MVKLFVGNLADTVDSTKLKQVFQQFTKVTECDVVKNYAFVHIDDADVESIISRLNGYTLEGKQIHIQISTSKLRPQPGMTNQCFRCASTQHRTPQCPQDPANQVTQTIKIDLTGGVKRGSDLTDGPLPKRAAANVFQLGVIDDEIPRPCEPDLQQLYEEYNLSRQRYAYYRDRLMKEIEAKRGSAPPGFIPTANNAQLSSAAVSYLPQQNPSLQPAYSVPLASGNHPYSAVLNLKAPYATVSSTSAVIQPVYSTLPVSVQSSTLAAPYIAGAATQSHHVQPAVNTQGALLSIGQGSLHQTTPAPYVSQNPIHSAVGYGQQMSTPMTTQQYLQQTRAAQQQQQPTTTIQLNVIPPRQSAPYTGGQSNTWIQQQSAPSQSMPVPSFYTVHGYRANEKEFGYIPDPPKNFKPEGSMRTEDSQRIHLINAFRRYGYLQAQLDPLGILKQLNVPELNPEVYGISQDEKLVGKDLNINDLAEQLRLIYCGTMAIEFMYINDWEERQWLAQHFENAVVDELRNEEKINLAKLMLRCENFDQFLALKFPTVKRYGSEGAEAMFGFFSEMFNSAPEYDLKQIFIGIAHRGRLNLLVEMMQYPVVQMFRKMRGKQEFPIDVDGSGDVLSHLTSSFDHYSPDGTVHVSLLPNPSHLEAVNPVAMGKSRARARTLSLGDYSSDRGSHTGDGVLCALIHGDGAFSGQGVVWESLALSQAPHFRLGGSVHLITNNQIAFTAEAHIGRSSTHCTDIAKSFEYPVIHVNGDKPEEVVKATRLAMAYRDRFRKDVFINLVCYRRWGHNELDDPTFTQPTMYRAIDERQSVPRNYADTLIDEGLLSEDELKFDKDQHTNQLLIAFRAIENTPPSVNHLNGYWKGISQAPHDIQKWDTGCHIDLLKYIGAASVNVPPDFNLHPHLRKTHCEARLSKLITGDSIDWASAEVFFFRDIISFVQKLVFYISTTRLLFFRHAMLIDQTTDESHIPLNFISGQQKGFLEVCGEIFKIIFIVAIICTLLYSGKWLTQSGLTLLLPHGFDGAGPEHSSCRMERFLQLCDSREDQIPVDGENVNMRIANPTTSAQYFHLLRRQIIPNFRKPLIIVAPKILLRHPKAASSLSEFAPGTHFRNVIADFTCVPSLVTKVILTSGKHWITLEKARNERGLNDTVAIIRVESLCPFPLQDLRETLQHYPKAQNPRRRPVRVVDDPRTGPLLENESEIRVDSPDQALFYLNTVADHRIVEKNDDNENIVQLASKLVRTRKTSRKGKLWSDTSSHSSGHPRSELESGSELSAAETVIFLGPRTLHRSPSFYPPTFYPPSSPTVSSKLTQTSESSVRTCTGSIPPILKGHTPFLSPSLRLYDDLCSPPGTSGLSDLAVFGGKCTQERDDFGITIASAKTKSVGLDDDKRQAIMRWVDTCEPLLSPEETEATGEKERGEKGRECAILSHPLEDIIEQDEESMKESLRSRREENSHPLSILSREGIHRMESTESMVQDMVSDEDALERAMAASVSSIRSHDILSKLRGDLSPKDISDSLTTVTPSEMDLYRRASHLEEYATERVKVKE
uniref:RRM domain-containing protein n=1 Tax=Heterorhabditis bacteriophora TaxID=37862 RepID=A0A1I7XLZ5_HETBA